MTKIFPAATVVLARDGEGDMEVLLLRRSQALSFGGGSWVFPGGRIDRDDYADDIHDIESAAKRGAKRETWEEANLHIDEQNLFYFSHWTTPAGNPKRFATWFFLSDVTDLSHDVEVDGGEIVGHKWYAPRTALEEYENSKIDMMPPTFFTLQDLAKCRSVAQAVSQFSPIPTSGVLPSFASTDKGIVMAHAKDTPENEGLSGAGDHLSLIDEPWRF